MTIYEPHNVVYIKRAEVRAEAEEEEKEGRNINE